MLVPFPLHPREAAPTSGRWRDSEDVVRIVYETSWVALGEYHCEPDDPRWRQENRTDEGHFVVFPWIPVRITQAGRDPVVCTPNTVMFYNRHQAYRRSLVTERGDHCAFVLVGSELLEEIGRMLVPQLQDPEGAPFPFSHGPSAPNTYLAHRFLIRYLRATPVPDELFVQERLCLLVADALARSFCVARTDGRPVRAPTRVAQAEMVEATKLVLSASLGEPLTFETVAAAVCSSPFHLARVFRQRTGFSLHAYRNQLRLRTSLERLLETDATLTRISADFGFSSLSHFTDAFRKTFGIPPSVARARAKSAAGSRRILEATASPAS